MENEYYKRYEPLFGSWYIKRFIGAGSYGKVFEIERKDTFGTVFTGALKAITIPSSQSELEEILTDGMDKEGASTYFRDYVKNLNREIALMSKLKGHSNIVSYEDHEILPHEDGIGWDILIRMELLTPITSYLKENHTFSQREVVRLGMDMCRALEVCKRYDIIHRDIKPANIFISETEDYKLGDFGVARVADTASGASTRVGTMNYMAPEVFRGKKYTSSVDIYSLGLVMYQLLNANRMPLYPPYPQPITPEVREYAQSQRLYGARLPAPLNADGRLAEIILKACEPDPEKRYSDPTVLRQDLEEIYPQVSDANIIAAAPKKQAAPVQPQPLADDGSTVFMPSPAQPQPEAPPQQKTPEAQAPVAEKMETQRPAATPVPVKKSVPGLPFILGAAAAVVLVLAGVFVLGGSKGGSVPVGQPQSSSVSASAAESASASAEEPESESSPADAKDASSEESAAASAAADSKPAEAAASSDAPASSASVSPAGSTKPAEAESKPAASSTAPAVEPAAPAAAAASVTASGSCGAGVNWELDTAGKLRIYGSGAMSDFGYDKTSSPWSSHADEIRSAVVEKGVITLGTFTFSYCYNLSSVSIADSVTSIHKGAFMFLSSNLKSVTIPKSVTEIQQRGLSGNSASFTVDAANPVFASVNGHVVSKDGTRLIAMGGSNTAVPAGVSVIESFACEGVKSISIPEGVTTIRSSAFSSARLSAVELPRSVKSIERGAFSGCSSLTVVTLSRDCAVADGAFPGGVQLNYYD